MTLPQYYNGASPRLVHEFISSIVEARRPALDAVVAAQWTAAAVFEGVTIRFGRFTLGVTDGGSLSTFVTGESPNRSRDTWGARGVIRVVLGHHGALVRGALAAVLSQEADLDVLAEIEGADDVLPAVAKTRPHVVVLDPMLAGNIRMEEVCLRLREPGILILIDRDLLTGVSLALVRLAPRVGFIATDASPADLAEAVRQLAHGAAVIDPGVAVAALRAVANPLTDRECEVLRLVNTGATAHEIARSLNLSAGTVRNYLSHILNKTAARSRIEAVRKAQEAGWI